MMWLHCTVVEFTLLSRLSRVRILPQKSSNFDTYRNFERSDLREDINAAEIVDGTLLPLTSPPLKKKKNYLKYCILLYGIGI